MNDLLEELNAAWDIQDKHDIENFTLKLMDRLFNGQIVGIAAGRMSYSLRAFIMRLSHMNASAFMIGDTNVPAVNSNSSIIINSSSGETPSLRIFAQQAKDSGAKIFLLTQNSKSSIGLISDHVLRIPKLESSQIMKTFPEQYTFILLDYIFSLLVQNLNIDENFLHSNHSIFE